LPDAPVEAEPGLVRAALPLHGGVNVEKTLAEPAACFVSGQDHKRKHDPVPAQLINRRPIQRLTRSPDSWQSVPVADAAQSASGPRGIAAEYFVLVGERMSRMDSIRIILVLAATTLDFKRSRNGWQYYELGIDSACVARR
jgi:hypothetical protein